MFKRSLMLILLLVILIPTGVQAQHKLHFTFVEVDLWPEYDRPSMLVILRAQVASDVDLSRGVNIIFRIPAAVGEPNAVATRQSGGLLKDTPYEREVDGMWAYITIQTSAPEIQVEFYDILEKQDSKRIYEYAWIGEHDADTILIQVQKPLGASQMRVEPAIGEFQLGSDGFEYYNLDIGVTEAGKPITVHIEYNKGDDALSVESLQQVQPSVPSSSNIQENEEADSMSFLPWIMAGASLVLIAIVAFSYWSTKRKSQFRKPVRGKQYTSSHSQKAKINTQEGKKAFCHNCGQAAKSGDKFCRGCGTKLR